MSLLNRFQKTFGFAFDDDSQEESEETAESVPSKTDFANIYASEQSVSSADNPPAKPEKSTSYSNRDFQEAGVDASAIFSGVIELLNRELPPYLRENLNEDGQKRYILENIDASLRNYIKNVGEAEKKKVEKSRDSEREKIKKSFEGLKERLHTAEEQLSKESEKTLSAERQKRAMALRIRDLESRISTLEAEKEQYDLENRSLLNKLRVVEVSNQLTDTHTPASANEEAETKVKDLELKATQMETKAAEMEKIASELEKKSKDLEVKLKVSETKLREFESKVMEMDGMLKEKEGIIRKQAIEMQEYKAVFADRRVSESSSGYEFISFENVSTPSPDAEKTPVEQQVELKPEKTKPFKKQGVRTKKKEVEKDDSLTDTDWLIEATENMDNPDRIVGNDIENGQFSGEYPSQMSLW